MVSSTAYYIKFDGFSPTFFNQFSVVRGVHSLFRGLGAAGKGSVGRSTVAGARVAAGMPCTGQTPVVSGSGEVERARRSTVYA
jgi:hypothetical protein